MIFYITIEAPPEEGPLSEDQLELIVRQFEVLGIPRSKNLAAIENAEKMFLPHNKGVAG
tara:strand:+ start:306 stop:482 length:177 start_codon:yes stop_codon:yes gene_type:complete